MTDTESSIVEAVEQGSQQIGRVQAQVSQQFVGQAEVLQQVIIALLAGGHVLLEGVPGLGKTLLVKSLAETTGGGFSRIQFTPDLMPSDVTGHALYDMKTQQFSVRRGPVFTNLLLADEINRAPAKTQAALLEVMQEGQVTIEGESLQTDKPFMVLATQNPIEQEGTYPLPEAELDRFMMKVIIDYPEVEDEKALVKLITQPGGESANLAETLSLSQLIELQNLTEHVQIDEVIIDYVVRIVTATRDWSGVAKGASPRASIALVKAAKAHALIQGQHFVTPDNVKAIALPVLRHRLQLTADMEIEGVKPDKLLLGLLDSVKAPRQ